MSSDYDNWFFNGHDSDNEVPPLPEGKYEVSFNGVNTTVVITGEFIERMYWYGDDGEIVANLHWEELLPETLSKLEDVLSDMAYEYWSNQDGY